MWNRADPFRGPKAATAPATVSGARPPSATGVSREGGGCEAKADTASQETCHSLKLTPPSVGRERRHEMKKLIGLAGLAALVATPALAHHPLAGAEMTTFTHGVLSGIGHLVLGFDHLFFVVAVGIVAALSGRIFAAPVAYIAGMLGGIALITNGIALPYVEFVIAGSLILLGGLAASGRAMAAPLAMALFAAAGLFHGWAFGETVTGQEAGMGAVVLGGYLLGLVAAQYAISVLAGWLTSKGLSGATDMKPRLAGAVVAGVGLTFFLEASETAIFASLGLG